MGNFQISNHSELLFRMEELKVKKSRQEEELKNKFKSISSSFDILSLFKTDSVNKKPVFGLLKVGLISGIHLMIDLILKKNKSVKGFVSSVFVEKLVAMLIDIDLTKLLSSVQNFLYRFVSNKK